MKTILYKIKLTTYNNKLKTTCKRRRIFKIELVKNLHLLVDLLKKVRVELLEGQEKQKQKQYNFYV
jgi:hypothetical protein